MVGAMGSTSFLGFSCPNLLLVFLNLGLSHFIFFCALFALKSNKGKVLHWIEVRTVFNVKTILQTGGCSEGLGAF